MGSPMLRLLTWVGFEFKMTPAEVGRMSREERAICAAWLIRFGDPELIAKLNLGGTGTEADFERHMAARAAKGKRIKMANQKANAG
jgi:hypothetical protein